MSDAKLHAGGCHCGRVRYEVIAPTASSMACTCSMCSKKGSLFTFVGEEAFALKSGEDNLTDYTFNKHVIHHTFCRTCGITSFARGTAPDGKKVVAINVRCLDDVDLEDVKVHVFDGKKL